MVTYQVKALLTTAVVSGPVGQTVLYINLTGQDHLGEGKDRGTPLQGWLRRWEAVFDPNHSAGPAAEYPYNEDLLKNKH